MTEKAILDPKQLTENLRVEIKQRFVNMIPETQFDEFIEQTITDFVNDEIKRVLIDELKKYASEKIKDYLHDKSIGSWNEKEQCQRLDEQLLSGIEKLVPKIFSDILSGAIQQALSGMSYNIQRVY